MLCCICLILPGIIVSIIQLAMIFFIVTNPIGNSPTIIALIKHRSIQEQQKILFREALFSLIVAIFFLFLGEIFLKSFNIEHFALTINGGILLFIIAFRMIFPQQEATTQMGPRHDPFIVPIATPLISGGGLLTMLMLYSKQENNDIKILLAILLAWTSITIVLVTAPYLQIFLGKRGLAALEQLMGMLLAMIAIEMIVQGYQFFWQP